MFHSCKIWQFEDTTKKHLLFIIFFCYSNRIFAMIAPQFNAKHFWTGCGYAWISLKRHRTNYQCDISSFLLQRLSVLGCLSWYIYIRSISRKYHWPEMPSFPASVLKFSFNACRVIWKSGIMEICQGVTDHPVGMSATDIGESCFDLFPSFLPPFNLIFAPFCHPCL